MLTIHLPGRRVRAELVPNSEGLSLGAPADERLRAFSARSEGYKGPFIVLATGEDATATAYGPADETPLGLAATLLITGDDSRVWGAASTAFRAAVDAGIRELTVWKAREARVAEKSGWRGDYNPQPPGGRWEPYWPPYQAEAWLQAGGWEPPSDRLAGNRLDWQLVEAPLRCEEVAVRLTEYNHPRVHEAWLFPDGSGVVRYCLGRNTWDGPMAGGAFGPMGRMAAGQVWRFPAYRPEVFRIPPGPLLKLEGLWAPRDGDPDPFTPEDRARVDALMARRRVCEFDDVPALDREVQAIAAPYQKRRVGVVA